MRETHIKREISVGFPESWGPESHDKALVVCKLRADVLWRQKEQFPCSMVYSLGQLLMK